MPDYSPKANALLQAGRGIHRPSRSDRERIAAALRARLDLRALPACVDLASDLQCQAAPSLSLWSDARGESGQLPHSRVASAPSRFSRRTRLC
jgi:hypothetical protein